MELQITTLIENDPDDGGVLSYEHGLSLYIEFQGEKILFDTGQTGDFLKNAEELGKAVQEVDYILVSHGHYDHSGGVLTLNRYLQEKRMGFSKAIPMLVGEEFFCPKYKRLSDGSFLYIGNPFKETSLDKKIISVRKVTEDVTYLSKNIFIFKNFTRYHEYEQLNPKFCLKTMSESDSQYVQDCFVDEIALGLLTQKGLVLIVGCSHVGIVNIIDTVIQRTQLPVYAVLGGTHLIEAGEERLQKTVRALKHFGIQKIAVSHCTGGGGVTLIEREFGQSFIRNNTGNIFRL